jgi:hypothetical protein
VVEADAAGKRLTASRRRARTTRRADEDYCADQAGSAFCCFEMTLTRFVCARAEFDDAGVLFA